MTRKPFFFVVLILVLLVIGVVFSFTLQKLNRLRPTVQDEISQSSVPQTPQRIICTAPNIVETVFALGEQKRIVGVSDFVTYPPEALAIDRIGGWVDPDYEKILMLRPDLVMIQGVMQKHEDFCRDKNIPLLRVDMDSMESIAQGIRSIGDALGCSEKAENLIRQQNTEFEAMRQKVSQIPSKPTVFICLGRRVGSLTGTYTVHPSSFVNELMQIAGGQNIFEDIQGRYPQVSKEALLVRNPEIILELHPGENLTEEMAIAMKKDWQAMPNLSAVASKRIYVVTDDFILVPGPRITQTAQTFFSIFHTTHD